LQNDESCAAQKFPAGGVIVFGVANNQAHLIAEYFNYR